MHEMGKVQDHINRIQKLKANLLKVSDHVLQKIVQMNETVKSREEERI